MYIYFDSYFKQDLDFFYNDMIKEKKNKAIYI